MTAERIISGRLLSFRDGGHIFHENGALVISREGRILWSGARIALAPEHARLPADDYGRCLVMPGFIDPHIHFPQYRILAAPAGTGPHYCGHYEQAVI